MQIKGVLSTKKGLGNKWFFNSKGGHYITNHKDWLINFKKFPPNHPINIIIKKVIKIKEIGSIQLNIIINKNLDTILLTDIYYYPGLNTNLILFGKFKWNNI